MPAASCDLQVRLGGGAAEARRDPHYHLAIWLPVRLQLPKFDGRGWWPHGMTQTVIGRAPVGYLMKYLSKTGPLQAFPKGARIHGYGGLTTQARSVCTWLNWPQWCKQRFGVGQLCSVAGRRVVRETGEVLEPMYTRVVVPAGMRLYPNGPLPDRWADGPYSLLEIGNCVQ
ncbi:rolling circle replication-associated protein [Ramlibacter pinisoli]|uniref:rolling circle replication-associated protein n=1 Tax=Ramlibacter pinisoli TaxID=2682844 RepID=UPI003B830261